MTEHSEHGNSLHLAVLFVKTGFNFRAIFAHLLPSSKSNHV